MKGISKILVCVYVYDDLKSSCKSSGTTHCKYHKISFAQCRSQAFCRYKYKALPLFRFVFRLHRAESIVQILIKLSLFVKFGRFRKSPLVTVTRRKELLLTNSHSKCHFTIATNYKLFDTCSLCMYGDISGPILMRPNFDIILLYGFLL